MFVRTDLSIPLKSRFSQPLSQVIVLNVSLNFFVPSLRSSLSSSRTNTLLTFTLYLTDYLYSFRAFGHYHKCCFVFCLPTTVSSSQWPKISLFSASFGRSSMLFPYFCKRCGAGEYLSFIILFSINSISLKLAPNFSLGSFAVLLKSRLFCAASALYSALYVKSLFRSFTLPSAISRCIVRLLRPPRSLLYFFGLVLCL